MSYFNSEQEDYMRELAEIPPEQRCYCGWYRLGQCPHCPKDKTCADKLKMQADIDAMVANRK